MALNFAGVAAQEVSHGNDASLTHSGVLTYCAWIKTPGALDAGYICSYWDAGAAEDAGYFYYGATGALDMGIDRAVQSCCGTSAIGYVTANAWQFLAGRLDTGGAAGDQELYRGTLTAAATECGVYATQRAGAGAIRTSGDDFTAANRNDDPGAWARLSATIGYLAVFHEYLTLPQIIQQQWRMRPRASCKILCHYGYNGAGGTQRDLSGTGNDGTPNNATLADHMPLGPFFGWDVPLTYQVHIPRNPAYVYQVPAVV